MLTPLRAPLPPAAVARALIQETVPKIRGSAKRGQGLLYSRRRMILRIGPKSHTEPAPSKLGVSPLKTKGF